MVSIFMPSPCFCIAVANLGINRGLGALLHLPIHPRRFLGREDPGWRHAGPLHGDPCLLHLQDMVYGAKAEESRGRRIRAL